jgi:hypothetical protein
MDIELLKIEIQDVRHCIGALQTRVDKLEELTDRAISVPVAPANANTTSSLLAPAAPQTSPTNPSAEETYSFGSFLSKELERREIAPPLTPITSSTAHNPNPHARTSAPANQSKSINGTPKRPPARVIVQEERRYSYDNGKRSSAAKPEPEAKRDGLEVLIGKHLNKIGISFLVLGCALALVYQFQYFSPLLKILSGVFAAIGLIAAGEYFEKKQSYEWYGRSLAGGGWALGYFSIYAAYHVDSVRIISNGLIDFVLLLAVGAGAILHSFKYKSETITCISLSLAFITIAISEITPFSLLACALLVMALAAITLKMRWYNLMVYGECIVYAIYLFLMLPKLMSPSLTIAGLTFNDANYTIATLFSSFCWAAFGYVNLAGKYTTKSERNYIITSTLINALAYVPTMLIIMYPSHQSWRFGFLLACAAGYGLSALSANRSNLTAAVTVQTFIALTLASFAIPFNFSGDWIPALWCVEVPLLIWTGLRYEMPVLRKFAGTLAAVVSVPLFCTWWTTWISNVPLSLVLGSTAVVSFGVAAALYRSHREELEHQSKDMTAFYTYFCLSVLLSVATADTNIGHAWMTMSYVTIGTAIAFLGFRVDDRFVRNTGLSVIFIGGGISFFNSLNTMSHLSMAVIVATLFYLAETYKRSTLSIPGTSRGAEYSLFASAVAVLTTLVQQLFPAFVSPAFAFEGLGFLLYGFLLQDKRARVAACAILALVACQFAISDDTWTSPVVTVLGLVVHKRILMAMFDCLVLSAAASCYLVPKLQDLAGKNFALAFYYYAALTGVITALATVHEAPNEWLALAVTLECICAMAIGIIFPAVKELRSFATIAVLVSQLAILGSTLGHWDGQATAILIALQFAAAFYYRRFDANRRVGLEHEIEHCYGAAGTLTLLLLLAQIMPTGLLTIAWTLEAITILTLGFQLQDKPYRVQGLMLLALVISRLLFVELASLATIYRILSFMGAGTVMLLASFAYARLSSRMQQQDGAHHA